MKPEKYRAPSRRKKQSSGLLFFSVLVILAVSLFIAVNSHQDFFLKLLNLNGLLNNSAVSTKSSEQPVAAPKDSTPPPAETAQQTLPAPSSLSTDATPPTEAQPPAPEPPAPSQAIERINAFYRHLDAQPYMQEFHLGRPSKDFFGEVIQKFLDNQPVVNRETDDIATIAKNTTHFFRIAGKNNMTVLRAVLEREKPSLEGLLADYASLGASPDALQKAFSLHVPANALYDYAGYFLNTIGGRLYLFRRDPAVRLPVTFYCILAIDKANTEANNRNGIPVKQAIDSLIDEIEASGNRLQFKDRYLDTLYDLKEKYQ
jgi:hypothetical protein